MFFAGSLNYDTKLDATGFQKGLDKITGSAKSGGATIKNIVAGLGITKIIEKGISVIANSVDDAVKRFDTLNNFPKVMQSLGIESEKSGKAIKKLSNKLTGLPTTLDSATSSVARFVSKNGDVDKSTDIFLALNNAIIAGGASMQVQSSALEQVTQAYSRGKFEMLEWKSLLVAAPGQMKQVASAFGMTTDELYEAMNDGQISMDAFMNKITELNTKGVKGFASFEQQAKNAVGGIETSVTNMKTAVTRGVTSIIEAIDKGLASIGMGSLAEVISNSGKKYETMLKNLASIIPSVIQQTYKLKGAIIGVVGAMLLYKATLASIKLSNDVLGMIQHVQNARIQWKLLTMEMRNATSKDIVFNKNISETQKLLLLLKKLDIGSKFNSIGFSALNASKGLGKFISTHKLLSGGILGVIGILGTLGVMLAKNGGDFGKTADQIKNIVSNIVGTIKNIASKIPGIVSNIISSVSNFVMTQGPKILNSVVSIGKKVINGIVTIFPKILPAIVNFLSVTLPNLILKGANAISSLITQFANKLPELINKIMPVITSALENGLPKLISMWANGLTNIVSSITKILPKIITSITKIVPQVIKTISSILPKIITSIVSLIPVLIPPLLNGLIQIVTSLISMIPTILPVIIKGLLAIVMGIVGMIGTILPPLISALIQACIMIIQAIVQALPTIIMALISAIPQIIISLVKGLIKCVPTLIKAGMQIIGLIVKSIPQIIIALIKAIPNIVKSMATALKNNWKEIFNAGLILIKKLWSGFKSWVSNLLSNIWNFAKSMPKKIIAGIGNVANIGKDLVRGIWNGISNAKDWVLEKIKGFGKSVVNGLKKIFKIGSPSKVMRDQIGKWLPAGIAVGIEANTDSALKAIDNMNDEIYKEMQKSVVMSAGAIKSDATINSNYGFNNKFTLNANFEGSVDLDGRKVGQIVTPSVVKTLKTGGAI